jgi:4,5-dihydroxyphthalate decarboxylase
MAPQKLATLLADYPNTLALKQGKIPSSLVELAFSEHKVANEGFKAMVRDARFDCGELAIATYLQAKEYGKPYVLTPLVVVGRDQHHTLFYNSERGVVAPQDLPGKRVGVRAYSQTTGAWLRGMLNQDFGVASNSVHWVTFEDPHIAEYHDPAGVERAPAGKKIVDMLLAGELDAAILGETAPDPRLKTVFPDARGAARDWARRNGTMPINHMLVVRQSLSREHPELVQEVFRMFVASKRQMAAPETHEPESHQIDPLPIGFERVRPAIALMIDYCLEQGMISRRFTVDELFDDTTRRLGA